MLEGDSSISARVRLRSGSSSSKRLAAVLAVPREGLLQTMGGRSSGVKLKTDIDPDTAEPHPIPVTISAWWGAISSSAKAILTAFRMP